MDANAANNLYYFKLNRIFDDGSMDIHVEQIDDMLPLDTDVRQLDTDLFDLPGGACIWHGYVDADSTETATLKVANWRRGF